MKISPITFTPIQKTSSTPQFKLNFQQDVFIKSKSANSVATTRLAEKYIPLSREMTDYILKSPEVTTLGIEKIIQKYSPNTSFNNLESLETNRPITRGSAGYTKIPVLVSAKVDGFSLTKYPLSLYAQMPEEMDNRNRIILTDRVLHECTHLLQENSKDRTSTIDFFNSYLKSVKNPQEAINDISLMPRLFSNLEDSIYDVLLSSDLEFDSLPKEIAKNITLDSICKKVFQKPAYEAFMYLIMACMNETNVKDLKLSLDYIILKAQDEREAYINALRSDKKLMNLRGTTDFDLRIEAYETIIKSAESLKARFKKLGLK